MGSPFLGGPIFLGVVVGVPGGGAIAWPLWGFPLVAPGSERARNSRDRPGGSKAPRSNKPHACISDPGTPNGVLKAPPPGTPTTIWGC